MEYLELISVPAIATIVYWVMNLIKYAVKDNEKFKRFIPLILRRAEHHPGNQCLRSNSYWRGKRSDCYGY